MSGEAAPVEEKSAHKPAVTASDISAASIASGSLAIGYSLGPTIWPGKAFIIAAPWLVLFLPYVISAVLNAMDAGLKEWQKDRHRAKMVSIANLAETEESQQELMGEVAKVDLERIQQLAKKVRGVDEKKPAKE
ncbi:hypothetical protein ACIQVL_19025 [Streptomyces sp. NPDC090499]|uniref:hypothetical protein n=1 Tax=Streptomyces sp. NPDC090499 TaxID=3365965 RepID=UPI003820BE33